LRVARHEPYTTVARERRTQRDRPNGGDQGDWMLTRGRSTANAIAAAPPALGSVGAGHYWASVTRIVFVVGLWSTIGLTVRFMQDAGPLEINGGRSLVMTFCLLVWIMVRRAPLPLRLRARGDWLPMVLVATFFAVGSTLTIVAVANTKVANVVCISATAPLVAALVAPWATGERTTPGLWLACAAALLGVWLVVGPGAGGTPNLGDLAALGSALCFGCQMVTLRRFRAVDLVPAYVLGGVVTATLCLGLAGGVAIGLHDALLILVMGSVQLALPAVMLLRGARDVPAVHMAILTMLDVALSPLWVWLAVGEGLTPPAIGGGLLIITAVVASAAQRARPAAGS
jgi:drug/metabolite transporter (DMT)-like permease